MFILGSLVGSIFLLLDGKLEKIVPKSFDINEDIGLALSVEELEPGAMFGGIFSGWRQSVNIKAVYLKLY